MDIHCDYTTIVMYINEPLSCFVLVMVLRLCGWCYRHASNLDNKRVDLFDGPAEGYGEENVLLASCKHMFGVTFSAKPI